MLYRNMIVNPFNLKEGIQDMQRAPSYLEAFIMGSK